MNAESDKKAKEDAEVINQADSTIFQVEKSLKDIEDKITEEQKSEVTTALEELKSAHSSRDIEKIKEGIENINNVFQGITANLYSQSSDINEMNNMNETDNNDSEVSDVDFEEVGK
jgi:molecular chaperone DnaK